MKESQLKGKLTRFMFISKILVVLFIFFEYSVKAFSLEQTIALISLVLPLFAVYLTTMLKDAGQNRHIATEQATDKEVRKSYVSLSRFIFILYPAAIIAVIYFSAEINSFTLAQSGIAAVETALGVYIAQVVMDLFKAKE